MLRMPLINKPFSFNMSRMIIKPFKISSLIGIGLEISRCRGFCCLCFSSSCVTLQLVFVVIWRAVQALVAQSESWESQGNSTSSGFVSVVFFHCSGSVVDSNNVCTSLLVRKVKLGWRVCMLHSTLLITLLYFAKILLWIINVEVRII